VKNLAPQRRTFSLRHLLTLALIPIAGLTFSFASAPDASAKGFKKAKISHHRGFRSSGFKFNRGKRFHRSFNRSSRRGHIARRNTQFSHNQFDQQRFNTQDIHRSPNFTTTRSGFGFNGPTTFRRNTTTAEGTNFIDQRAEANRGPAIFTPPSTLAPEYRIAPLHDNEAWALLAAGRYHQGQIAFGRLATAGPDNADFKIGFALASAALGQFERAETAFARAQNLRPGTWGIQEDHPAAGALARDLIAQHPDLADELAASLKKITEATPTQETPTETDHTSAPYES